MWLDDPGQDAYDPWPYFVAMTTKHHAIPQYYLDMQKQPLNRSSDYFAN
jgi:hypothetical protein